MRDGWRRAWAFAIALSWAPVCFAQQFTAPQIKVPTVTLTKSPVLITADQVTYDRDLGVVVASGHVEVSQEDRVLKADTLTYNERQKTVTASGNVALLDNSGNVVFADYMELSDDLKNAVIQNIRLLLSDKSRMAAASGKRTGQTEELDKVVYSPCKPCETDPKRPLIWQLKADRAVHDGVEHTMTFHNAWMDIFGVPVFYAPYFSIPDPTVKRKSGFLPPRFSSSQQLGVQAQIPYFWVINPSSDLTFAPIFLTKVPPVLAGEYRQRFVDGSIKISGSATVADITTTSNGVTTTEDSVFRGHVFANGRFDLNDNWRAGFDINRVSDPNYLRLYNFPNNYNSSLDSTVYAEGFDNRSYASFRSWAFQGLQDGDINTQNPIVAPLLNYNLVSEPGPGGAYWTVNADAMVLSRIEGRDSRRVSANVAWTLPYTAPAGDIYKLTASVRADGYWVNGVDPNSNNPDPTSNTVNGVTGRIFPQLSFDWRYPFVRRSPGISQVFEPIFSADVAPNGGNPGMIPNEDSLDFQFDETNVFDPNRFTGLDRVDNGQRVNYGFKYSIYGDGGGHSSLLVGQSYQFNNNNAFAAGAGQISQLSNLVGALVVSPNANLDLLYRFQIQTTPMSFLRQEFGMRGGNERFHFMIDYALLNGSINDGSQVGTQQELTVSGKFKINDEWSLTADVRQDLQLNQTLEYGAGILYQNECIGLEFLGSRSNYTTNEITPDTRFMLIVNFKNLGAYGASL